MTTTLDSDALLKAVLKSRSSNSATGNSATSNSAAPVTQPPIRHDVMEKERTRKRRSHSRSRSRERTRERTRERPRERPREERERERERRVERSRDYYYYEDRHYEERRSRYRSRSPPPPPPSRHQPPRTLEQEIERMDRTVGVFNLASRVRSRDLFDFFQHALPSPYARVVDAKIVRDNRTGASKGIGYVEFETADAVERALEVTGKKIMGKPCIVQRADAEKQLLIQQMSDQILGVPSARQLAAQQNQHQSSSSHSRKQDLPRRVLIENLHPNLTQDEVRKIFEQFGPILHVEVIDPTSTHTVTITATMGSLGNKECKSAHVEFRHPEDARRALDTMNGFQLANYTLRLGFITTPSTTTTAAIPTTTTTTTTAASTSTAYDTTAHPSSSSSSGSHPHHGRMGMDASHENKVLVDDGDEFGSTHRMSRADLMARLSRSRAQAPAATTAAANATTVTDVNTSGGDLNQERVKMDGIPPRHPTPTRNVLLTNMFDPTSESSSSSTAWATEIRTDVLEECHAQFGVILHIFVDPVHPAGLIYMKFESVDAAERAVRGLEGRWFAKRQIGARWLSDEEYGGKFPEAVGL